MRAAILLLGGCGRVAFDPIGGDGGVANDSSSDAAPLAIYASIYPGKDLYRIDPTSLAETFDRTLCGNLGTLDFGEIVFDAAGVLIATGFPEHVIYRVDQPNDNCTTVALDIAMSLKGAELLPAGVAGPAPVLIAVAENGGLYRVDATTGTTQSIGNIGFTPSGDLAWTGTQLLVTEQSNPDRLHRIDPTNAMTSLIGNTTLSSMFGLSWYDGELYGFTNGGDVVTLNLSNATPVRSANGSHAWGGAVTH